MLGTGPCGDQTNLETLLQLRLLQSTTTSATFQARSCSFQCSNCSNNTHAYKSRPATTQVCRIKFFAVYISQYLHRRRSGLLFSSTFDVDQRILPNSPTSTLAAPSHRNLSLQLLNTVFGVDGSDSPTRSISGFPLLRVEKQMAKSKYARLFREADSST